MEKLNTLWVTQMEIVNVQQRELLARYHKFKLPLIYHTSIHTTLFYKHTDMKCLIHTFHILFYVVLLEMFLLFKNRPSDYLGKSE